MRKKTVYAVVLGAASIAVIAYGSYRYFDSSGDGSAPPMADKSTSTVPTGGASSGGAVGVSPPVAWTGRGLPAQQGGAIPIGQSPLLSPAASVPRSGNFSPAGRSSSDAPYTKKELVSLARERRREAAEASGKLAEFEATEKKREERRALHEEKKKKRKEWRIQEREARRLKDEAASKKQIR